MKRLSDIYEKYVPTRNSSMRGSGFDANLYKDIEFNKKMGVGYPSDKVQLFVAEDVCKYTKTEKPSRFFISVTSSGALEKQFNEFAIMWRKETAGLSTKLHMSRNKYYNYIIGMGSDAVPFILKDLQNDPDWWFIALNYITKENPVQEEHLGNLYKMAEDWIAWGKKRRII